VTGRIKLSHDKATYPGSKQIWRFTDEAGKYASDVIAVDDEQTPDIGPSGFNGSWRRLLVPVMRQGRLVEAFANIASDQVLNDPAASKAARLVRLNEARDLAGLEVKRLPDNLLALDSEETYPVVYSDRLTTEQRKLEERITEMSL
jgi:hypothetical protein